MNIVFRLIGACSEAYVPTSRMPSYFVKLCTLTWSLALQAWSFVRAQTESFPSLRRKVFRLRARLYLDLDLGRALPSVLLN